MSNSGEIDPPTRDDVRQRMLALINGDLSRVEVSDWAAQWIRMRHPNIDDPVVWEAIQKLVAADLQASKTSYLYNEEDFVTWLKDFENV